MENVETERRLAIIETELGNIKELLLEIRNQPNVPRQELREMFARRDERIKSIEDNVKDLNEDERHKKGLWASWAAVIVGVAALIISLYK